MTRDTPPPSGWPPPDRVLVHGAAVDLGPLAEAVADRYFAEFPEDLERYGPDIARAWELHDTRHVLSWAFGDVEEEVDLGSQVRWLAQVLAAREFPLEHLARNLELAADVVAERAVDGPEVAARLRTAAHDLRPTS